MLTFEEWFIYKYIHKICDKGNTWGKIHKRLYTNDQQACKEREISEIICIQVNKNCNIKCFYNYAFVKITIMQKSGALYMSPFKWVVF